MIIAVFEYRLDDVRLRHLCPVLFCEVLYDGWIANLTNA